jgi:hypothetical protein
MIIIFCGDPLFAVAVGKEDPLGTGRAPQDQGRALASASTAVTPNVTTSASSPHQYYNVTPFSAILPSLPASAVFQSTK